MTDKVGKKVAKDDKIVEKVPEVKTAK